MAVIIRAGEFDNRSHLDKAVIISCGGDINKNRELGHKILGSREELRQLGLDDTSSVFGVGVDITDQPSLEGLKKRRNA